MPYALRGNSVVRSDTGAVVKSHPSREKALAHLRALKANVSESSPALLGSLLEGFDAGKHPRNALGRWIATFHHSVHGTITSPVEASSIEEARTKAEANARAMSGGRVNATLQSLVPAEHAPTASVSDLLPGPQGSAARARGASALTTEHADTRDKLVNLPEGQRYGLHGPQGQVGHVERTSSGWRVVSGADTGGKVHKSPSSAAGAAMRLQRKAASSRENANVMMRNYRAGSEVEGMNARQAQRAEAERARAAQVAAAARLAAPNAQRSDEMASGPLQKPGPPGASSSASKAASDVAAELTAKGWTRDATGKLESPHGGFKVGDQVTTRTAHRDQGRGPVQYVQQHGVHEVVGLQRNGNLRVKEPGYGTTVDVHHSDAQIASPAARREAELEANLRTELGALPEGLWHSVPERLGGSIVARRVGSKFEVYNVMQAKPHSVERNAIEAARVMMQLRKARSASARESAQPAVLGVLLEGR